MTPKRPTFAERLRAARDARGLSQYALAKLTGLTKQTVSQLESGSQPSWATVQLLALALGADFAVFADPAIQLPPAGPPPKLGRPRKQTADADQDAVRRPGKPSGGKRAGRKK